MTRSATVLTFLPRTTPRVSGAALGAADGELERLGANQALERADEGPDRFEPQAGAGVDGLDALDQVYHVTELIQSSPLAVERCVHGMIGGGFWWTVLFDALAIASLVIGVNLVTDGVQGALND